MKNRKDIPLGNQLSKGMRRRRLMEGTLMKGLPGPAIGGAVAALLVLAAAWLTGKWHWGAAVLVLVLGWLAFSLVRETRKLRRAVVTRERDLDRMKTEFITTASHELRTPLTSVKGFSQLLLDDKGLSTEQQEEYLGHILEKSRELEKIVHDLLDFSRGEVERGIPLKKELCDIAPHIRRILARYRTHYPGHGFEERLPERPLALSLDPVEINRALENLLGNAVKFSPDGGRIEVACEVTETEIRIYVEDEGIGMTSEQTERAFDEFYRVDASNTATGGLGLGLSVSREIIEAHGGKIWLESERGKGTTVSFTLARELAASNGRSHETETSGTRKGCGAGAIEKVRPGQQISC